MLTALSCNNLTCQCSEHAELLKKRANDIMLCCIDGAPFL